MSFTKFVSLLTSKSLFFARADKLGDPFEGALSPLNTIWSPIINERVPPETIELVHNAIKDRPRFALVNCWHESEHESAAMWKIYSGGGEGIAIKTDFFSLRNSFTGADEVYIGRVNYVDYSSTFIKENDPLAPLLYKRKSFEHEREVRVIFQGDMPRTSAGDILVGTSATCDTYKVGSYREVDVATLIKEVVVAPYTEDWFVELVQKTITGLSGIQCLVTKSTMETLYV